MQRRAFLQTAAAVLPAATLPKFLSVNETAAPPPQESAQPPELHVVDAGEDRYGHPHPLGFSTITFKVGTAETGGRLFIIEHSHAMPGGPVLHLHINQDEWFYVIEGDVDFQIGDRRLRLHPGESVLGPRRVPHTFSPVGPGPSHLLIAFTPAGKMEQYFLDIEPPHKQPADQATFLRKYEMEYVGPSPFWKT
ncbi:MAG: cupin domain-containing protein [Candidatus Acidiferrales bacterium]